MMRTVDTHHPLTGTSVCGSAFQPTSPNRPLRAQRAECGMTQLQLAALCGLTNGYISKVEQGHRNIGLGCLEALAVGLDCWPADLLTPLRAPAPATLAAMPAQPGHDRGRALRAVPDPTPSGVCAPQGDP